MVVPPQRKPNKAIITTRRERVFDLRLEGRTFAQIAAEVGCATSTVAADLETAYSERLVPRVDQLREMESARLDKVEASAWDRHNKAVEDDDTRAVLAALQLVLKASEGRRRLLKLDLEEPAGVQSDRAIDAAGTVVADVLAQVLPAVASAATQDSAFAGALRDYGLDYARWLLTDRQGPIPAAPVDPAPPLTVVQEVDLMPAPNVSRWARAGDRSAALAILDVEVTEFEERWGPVDDE